MVEERTSKFLCQQELPKLKCKEKKGILKTEQNVQEWLDNYKMYNICIIMAEKSPKLGTDTNTQIQILQRMPHR